MDSAGMFQYRKTENGVVVLACKNLDDTAIIPEKIGNIPVVELAAYAFSKRRLEPCGSSWAYPGSCFWGSLREPETLPLLCGERLKAVMLPPSLRKIGNYAFYNCYYLKRIVCHSTLEDLGSGMFTGCNHISEVDITIHRNQKSCMKELLSEIRQRVVVHYHSEEGEAVLIFPEFFEEAVENTPARILYTATHGSGHRYRYCFQDTNFQFKEYDSLFIHEIARETTALALELAMYRLVYPLHLLHEAKKAYAEFVEANWNQAADMLMGHKDLKLVKRLLEQMEGLNRVQIAALLDAAGHAGFTEASGYLLDYMRIKFPAARKKFIL